MGVDTLVAIGLCEVSGPRHFMDSSIGLRGGSEGLLNGRLGIGVIWEFSNSGAVL